MGRFTKFAIAGATVLGSTAALAADLPPAYPPMMPQFVQPAPVAGGWYLRGDVGVGIQNYRSFDFHQTNVGVAVWPASWRIDQKDIKDTFLIGGGIGYQWNNWFRFDITGEYRADVKFKAVGSYTEFCANGGRCFDVYDGDHLAAVALANFYFDLGTWWCLTPFVGFGVGGVYHKISALSDGNFNAGAFGFAPSDHTQWNFAWAAHAGVAYTVTNNFKVEFSYRYLNMGDVNTAEILCGATGCGTGSGPRAYYTLRGFDSHDLRIGMRWLLQPEAPPPVFAPPLIRKG